MSTSPQEDTRAWPLYKRLLGYVKPYWPLVTLALVGMVLDAGALTAFVHLVKPLLDQMFVERDPYVIFWMPIWIVLIFAVRGFATFAERYGTAYIGRGVVQQMQMDIFNTYQRLGALFFSREPSGHQVARIT